jgi:hypothetical protein
MQTAHKKAVAKRGRRPLAMGLSLLLLGLQLVGLAHLTLERHGVCWEHGSLTELGTSKASASLLVPHGSGPGLHLGFPVSRLEDAEGHHHCPVQASRRDWGASPAGEPLVLALGETRGQLSVQLSVPWADEGLLHRAPKLSPPATA